jgi:hypothetical protein
MSTGEKLVSIQGAQNLLTVIQSGNVDFPIIRFVGGVPGASTFNLLFLIPLFLFRRDQ